MVLSWVKQVKNLATVPTPVVNQTVAPVKEVKPLPGFAISSKTGKRLIPAFS